MTAGPSVLLLFSTLGAAAPAPSSAGPAPEADAVAAEPEGGAGVSPLELIPRLELRQSYVQLANGVATNAMTPELDMQFFRRVLLRWELPLQVVKTPEGQIAGVGDVRLETLLVVTASEVSLVGAIAGAVLDTASQPQLGAGKQQVFFGGGAAFKPFVWWLLYGVAQQRFSAGGDSARPDVNHLLVRVGTVVFGRHRNWFKLDLDTRVDWLDERGRLFGTLELGGAVIERVGLFARGGTQLVGQRELDFSLVAGVRYLFRLEKSKP